MAKIHTAYLSSLLFLLSFLGNTPCALAQVTCATADISGFYPYTGIEQRFTGGPGMGESYWSANDADAWPPYSIGSIFDVIYQTPGLKTVTFTNRLGETTTCDSIWNMQQNITCSPARQFIPVGGNASFTSSISENWKAPSGSPSASAVDSTSFSTTFSSAGSYVVTVGDPAPATTGACIVHVGTHACTVDTKCNYPAETCVNCSADCGSCDPTWYKTYVYSNGASTDGNYNASSTAAGAQPLTPGAWNMNSASSSHFVTAQVSGARPSVAMKIDYGLYQPSGWANWYNDDDFGAPNGGCTATECRFNFNVTNPTNTPMTVKIIFDYTRAPAICNGPLTFDPWSNPSLTTSSPISLRNITDLRTAIDLLRVDAGLGNFTWTDNPLLVDTPSRAIHINELRQALLEVYNVCQSAARFTGTIPPFLSTRVTAGVDLVSLTHILELREAVTNAP